ncbi:unnamed protein product [Bemisia tabaci]|uniref:Zinc finger protein n=1 Tax=Bemisia tabaci TaxID=7038 RepID=A0A9P0A2L4_BEMTA|nr:PREDICTED: zinc finger protein 181-like isoform X1 [Bemisia tabaci]UYS90919.1 C2H2 zinc finger protein [Bemisia tabaci]CAH0383088.1 unnamed protein product [Bemisia tabaci]
MAGYRRVSYYDLCRLCTASDGTKMHIFREEGRRRQIPTKIQLCLPLQINEDDSLPKSICNNCADKLESFYNFRESCLTAEAMLEGFQDFKREGMVYVKDETLVKAETSQLPKEEDSPNNVQVVETSCMVPVSVEGLQNLVQAGAVHIINDPASDKGLQYKIPIPLQLQCGTTVIDSSQQIRYNIAEVSPQTAKSVQEASQLLQTANHKESQNFSEKASHNSGTQTDSNREVVISQAALNNDMFVQFANFKDSHAPQDEIVHRANITGIANIGDYLRLKMDEPHHELADEAKDIECGRCGKRLSSSEVTEHCISCFDQQPTTIISEHPAPQHIQEKIPEQGTVRNVEAISIQYTCEICGRIFKKKELFEEHHKSHADDSMRIIFSPAESDTHLSEFVRVPSKPEAANHLSSQDQVNSVVVSYANQVSGDEMSPQVSQDFLATEIKAEDQNQSQATVACDVCGKPFKRKEHLFQHRKLHSGERPFVCSTCNKAFGRKEHLLRHMLAHTGQKVHDCDLCGKSFSRKDNLLKHKKIHGISGPFSCEICGKSFVVKHYYMLHLNCHQNEQNGEDPDNPLRCDVCNKVFSDKSHLLTHKARHRSRGKIQQRLPQRQQSQDQSPHDQQQQQAQPQQSQQPQQTQQTQVQQSEMQSQLTQVVQCQSPVAATSSSNEENQDPLSTVNTAAILAPSILHTSSAQVFQMPTGTTYLCTPTITSNQFIDNLRRLSSPAT